MHTTTSTISTKNQFLYFSHFSPLFHPYVFTKLSLQSPPTLPSSISQQFCPSSFLGTTIVTKNIFPTSAIESIQAVPREQGARESCEGWNSFNLSHLPQNIGSDNRDRNYWFFITQAQKIGVLHVVVSDEDSCNRNGKLSNPLFHISSNYCHYFHTLLIPLQGLPFPWKPVP